MAEEAKEKYELHTEYRPLSFDEFIGNSVMKAGIMAVIDTAHVYIFYGPRGCGKTTLARLIGKQILADKFDIHEINGADKTGVDDMRPILNAAQFTPMGGKTKLYIIDEFHRLSQQAQDSMLKILEEPPKHCYFVLCTTEPEKIRATIKSRGKLFEVKPLTPEESCQLIDWVCKEERITLPPAVRQAIVDRGRDDDSQGIPREMLVALDMVRNMPSERDAIATIQSGSSNAKTIDLARALLAKSTWKEIGGILSTIVDEPETTRYVVLGYMNAVLTKSENDKAAFVISCFASSFMYSKKAGLTAACYDVVKNG